MARLVAALSREDEAVAAVETAVTHVGQRRREKPGEPLPEAWVTRLEDLYAELYLARCALDDCAHAAAAASPRWVAMSINNSSLEDRPVLAEEASWLCVARRWARALEGMTTLVDPDRAWDVLGEGMDDRRDATAADAARALARGRCLVRSVVRERYGGERT